MRFACTAGRVRIVENGTGKCAAYERGGVSPQRERSGGFHRGLLGSRGNASGVMPAKAGRNDGENAAASARARRKMGGCACGLGSRGGAGADALAVAEFFRVLPSERIISGDHRGHDLDGAWGAGDVVGDEPGVHGSGNAGAGLAGGDAGVAGFVFVNGEWWWGDSLDGE